MKNYTLCFYLTLIFFTFSSVLANAQNKITANYINVLLQEGDSLSDKVLFSQSLSLYKKANLLAKQIRFEDGIIRSDFKIARTLNDLGFYKDCFEYLNYIEEKHQDLIAKNPEFKYMLIEITGINFLKYDFKRQAVIEFKKLPPLIDLAFKDESIRSNTKIRSYVLIASCYEFVNNDTAYYYMRKAAAIIKSRKLDNTLNVPKIFQRNVLSVYRNLADYKLYFSHDMDSAYYYSNKTLALGEHVNSPYMFLYERQRSQILHSDKKYKQSLDYSLRSLKKVNEKRAKEELIEVYRLIAGNYREMGDKDKSNYYIAKYDLLRDSLANTRKEGIIVSSDYMNTKRHHNELSEQKEERYKLISGIILAIILCTVFTFVIIRNRQKEKRLKSNIELKKQKLLEKEGETQQLKSKVNDSFGEVITLAKKNSPEFVTRFIEVYPEFYHALLKIYPDINTENLKFCALLRLNFSTKDIADYNFITIRAIQLRKNRLRKKLNISSSEDIYSWMNGLDKNTAL